MSQDPVDDLRSDSAGRLRAWIPYMERDQRRELSLRIAAGAIADADYVIMMGLAATLASLGLLQGSTAVVIGAMLVAPLMSPLIAAGLALAQGNGRLFRMGVGVSLIGMALGFGVSLLVGLANPGYEPSMEIEARGRPDLMDLGIALASGMAAAYASGRPKVAGTLAGVAIAAALVPPLAVVGIALTNDELVIAYNAAILLVTNLVAIILGAALMYWLLGVSLPREVAGRPAWARRARLTLVMLVIMLSAPLFLNILDERREGQARPLLYPASPAVRDAVWNYVDQWPGIETIMIGRPGVERQDVEVGVVLASYDTIPEEFDAGLRKVIRDARGDDPDIYIYVLRSAYPSPKPHNPVEPTGAGGTSVERPLPSRQLPLRQDHGRSDVPKQ